MFQKLKHPYALETSAARRWRSCLLYSGFVFIFLLVFRPFGLSELPEGILKVTLGYGLTTFAVMAVLNVALVALLPRYFSEARWTVGRELLWVLLNIALIGFANMAYSGFIGQFNFSVKSFFLLEVYTLAVGIFPVGISILVKEARLSKKYEKNSTAINALIKELPAQITAAGQHALVTIPSETGGEALQLDPENLLYIHSADNYVEVFYWQGAEIKRRLLRNSLKNISGLLAGHTYLFRCHKSYLVNLRRVSHVSGNAQGYKLHLHDHQNLVPVSRQLNEEIKARLAATP